MSSYKIGEIAALLSHSKKKSKNSSNLEQLSTLFNDVGNSSAQKPVYVAVTNSAPTKSKQKKEMKQKRKIGQEHSSINVDSDPFLEGHIADKEEEENTNNEFKRQKKLKKTLNPICTTQTSQKLIHQEENKESLSRTIFVGNLPINIGKKQLKAIFRPYGQIESLRIRSAAPSKPSLPKKVAVIRKDFHPERSSIQSYVVFKSVEDAHSALQVNAALVMGHHLIVNPASSGKVHNHKNSIFVGNLPFNIEEEELWSAFSECGEVQSVRIIRDPTTGIGKGYGFVLFKSADAATVALQMDGSEVKGRKVRVSHDKKPKDTKRDRHTLFMPQRLKKQNKNFQGSKFSNAVKKRKGRKELRQRSKEKHKKIVAKILNS